MHCSLKLAALAGAFTISLVAAPLSGTFTIAGNVTVEDDGVNGCTASGGCIVWSSSSSIPDQATITNTGLSGSFAGDANQTVTINNLYDSSLEQPIGTPFTGYNFLDFSIVDGFPDLQANFIPLGTGGASDCSTDIGAAAASQTCTLNSTTVPPEPGGSPIRSRTPIT